MNFQGFQGFYDNGEMRKNNKAELMNEISTILIDVLMESTFHVIDRYTWLYCIYWAKDLHSSSNILF